MMLKALLTLGSGFVVIVGLWVISFNICVLYDTISHDWLSLDDYEVSQYKRKFIAHKEKEQKVLTEYFFQLINQCALRGLKMQSSYFYWIQKDYKI